MAGESCPLLVKNSEKKERKTGKMNLLSDILVFYTLISLYLFMTRSSLFMSMDRFPIMLGSALISLAFSRDSRAILRAFPKSSMRLVSRTSSLSNLYSKRSSSTFSSFFPPRLLFPPSKL